VGSVAALGRSHLTSEGGERSEPRRAQTQAAAPTRHGESRQAANGSRLEAVVLARVNA